MDQRRGLLRALLGMAALAAFALVIVWLYKAHNTIPSSSAGAAASAPRATPTLPGPPEASPPVVDTVTEAPPPTAMALPSQLGSPLATATAIPSVAPTATAGDADGPLVIEGYGDFPRMAVTAPFGDQGGLALYLVEGSSAVRVAEMPDLNFGSTTVRSVLSPSGAQLAACFYSDKVDLFNLGTGERHTVAELPGTKYAEGSLEGWARETLESVTWWDEEHVVYTKVRWMERRVEGYEGEAWLASTDGSEQQLLARGRFVRVLGVSADATELYVIRRVPGREELGIEGFGVLDLASGEVRPLWPEGSTSDLVHNDFRLVSTADGLRVSFVQYRRIFGRSEESPTIWLGDPETGEAKLIATVGEVFEGSRGYYAPFGVTFGPEPSEEIAYMNGGREGSPVTLWVTSLETGISRKLATLDASTDWITMSPLTWVGGYLVVRDGTAFSLYSLSGDLAGEIDLAREGGSATRRSAADAVVELPVPPTCTRCTATSWFDGGWSCGPFQHGHGAGVLW